MVDGSAPQAQHVHLRIIGQSQRGRSRSISPLPPRSPPGVFPPLVSRERPCLCHANAWMFCANIVLLLPQFDSVCPNRRARALFAPKLTDLYCSFQDVNLRIVRQPSRGRASVTPNRMFADDGDLQGNWSQMEGHLRTCRPSHQPSRSDQIDLLALRFTFTETPETESPSIYSNDLYRGVIIPIFGNQSIGRIVRAAPLLMPEPYHGPRGVGVFL
jgi:hypothetical protein